MTTRFDAKAKGAEGRLESAYGELTDDTGHKIQGKAKQMQASAMNVVEDVKDAARSASRKVQAAMDRDAMDSDGMVKDREENSG
jgi:uncharacterized protein YjbJ (UPF0337 family)